MTRLRLPGDVTPGQVIGLRKWPLTRTGQGPPKAPFFTLAAKACHSPRCSFTIHYVP
jgi:hypothetical protein